MAESEWAEAACKRFMDVASDLAGRGELSNQGVKGMLTSGTVVLEFVGEDGYEWHSIVNLPQNGWRNSVVHLELLRRYVQSAEWTDG